MDEKVAGEGRSRKVDHDDGGGEKSGSGISRGKLSSSVTRYDYIISSEEETKSHFRPALLEVDCSSLLSCHAPSLARSGRSLFSCQIRKSETNSPIFLLSFLLSHSAPAELGGAPSMHANTRTDGGRVLPYPLPLPSCLLLLLLLLHLDPKEAPFSFEICA